MTLILKRITPGVLDANLTFEKILDLMLLLTAWINRASKFDKGRRLDIYKEKLTAVQQRIVLYFRLCAQLQQAPRLVEFYEKSKAKKIEFTSMMYSFALRGVSNDAKLFPSFTNIVLRDMSMDAQEPDATHFRNILVGACRSGDVAAALECFRKLELAYLQTIT